MKKRIVALLMALCLVVGLFPAVSAADVLASGTCGENLTWRLEGDTLYIDGEGDMDDYELGGYVESPFAYYSTAPWARMRFTKVELAPGVTSIGERAFFYCEELTEINLHETKVQRMGELAFAYTNLHSIALPEGLTTIPYRAFDVCSLKEISIPESVTRIESRAFGYTNLTIVLPKNLNSMGENVFMYAEGDVYFTGDAPEIIPPIAEDTNGTFGFFQGTVYYPGDNPSWTEDIINENSEWCPWVPYILNPFTDVKSSDYYYEPVLWALEHNITSGTGPDEFSPYDSCLRSQVVTFLWRAAGEPKAESKVNPFVDMKPTDYYYDAVLWAVEKGITTGADATHFEPNGVCNRSQVVTFLYRAFEKPPVSSGSNPFTDVSSGAWYAPAVFWAVNEGITNGLSETKFGPNEVCNRSQVVTFLHRAYVN